VIIKAQGQSGVGEALPWENMGLLVATRRGSGNKRFRIYTTHKHNDKILYNAM